MQNQAKHSHKLSVSPIQPTIFVMIFSKQVSSHNKPIYQLFPQTLHKFPHKFSLLHNWLCSLQSADNVFTDSISCSHTIIKTNSSDGCKKKHFFPCYGYRSRQNAHRKCTKHASLMSCSKTKKRRIVTSFPRWDAKKSFPSKHLAYSLALTIS